MDSIESARQSMRDVSEFVQTVSKIRENIQLVLNTPTDFAARIQDLLTLTKETVLIVLDMMLLYCIASGL